jgi:hypothetical protein
MALPLAEPPLLDRREFIAWVSRQGLKAGLIGASMPAILAACGRDDEAPRAAGTGPGGDERVLVGDVLDYALTSSDWSGAFGFVTFRLQKGVVDGRDVHFIRTDTSDEGFAREQKLVWAPRIASLASGLSGAAYLISRGPSNQQVVLSSEPGRPDYTPAWRVHRVTWTTAPRTLTSVADIDAASAAGEVSVEETGIVLNGAVVKWSSGEMPVDNERREYLGPGQLLEAPDVAAGTVTFKLHECFPGVRYIVSDTSMAPMAEGMHIVHSPRLEGGRGAEATGRTNVFMNGLRGPGPMGFQPSVFDSQAGDAAWSPYWDHMTYAWKDGNDPRVLTTEREVHEARDAGELDEFPGTPDTKGTIFTVNCPVPVLAPSTFRG